MAHDPPSTPSRSRTARSTSISTHSPLHSPSHTLSYRLSPRNRTRSTLSIQFQNGLSKEKDGRRERRAGRGGRAGERIWGFVRRRWAVVVLLALAVVVVLYLLLRTPERPPLIIPKRPYTLQEYRHLDQSLPISLRPATRILHVTKEFGPATMGGLGVMLTALSIAQSDSPLLAIAVALPHYSYLHERYSADEIRPFANLTIPITTHPSSSSRPAKHIRVPVSLLRWSYTPSPDFLHVPSPANEPISDPPSRTIDIYLLGPSDSRPFSAAFRAKDEGDIYSAYKPLKQEWKDLYFARAAAELVAYLGAKDEATVFEDDDLALDEEEPTPGLSAKRRVDVVHLHGATNAFVAHFLREREKEERHVQRLQGRHPAIVYTLHDSLDEVEYSNLVENVVHFLPPAPAPTRSNDADDPRTASHPLARLQPYIYRSGTQLFTSALGIDLADRTTFVSRSIAADIVSGRFRFHLQDLVMPSIARRAAKGEFVGVTNGLDFTERERNPFTSPKLVERGLAFPRVRGGDLFDPSTFPSSADDPSFVSSKRRARAFLVSHLPQHFSPTDLSQPWFVFIGRYQYNKGCQFFSTLLEEIARSPGGGTTILSPFSPTSPAHTPSHLTLIDDDRSPSTSSFQRYGTLIRLASDFAFVPSLSEAFGLVAAEALLFGMKVVSTGVGGLGEFLVPIREGEEEGRGNSYLFDLFPDRSKEEDVPPTQGAEEEYSRSAQDVRPDEEMLQPAREKLRKAVRRAVRDWERERERSVEEREREVRRLVGSALELRWDREGGPVDEYIRVYDRALNTRRRRLGLPRSIPSPSPLAPEQPAPTSHEQPHRLPSRLEGVVEMIRRRGRKARGSEGDHDGSEARPVAVARKIDGGGLSLPIFKVWDESTAVRASRPKPKAKTKGRGRGKGKGGGKAGMRPTSAFPRSLPSSMSWVIAALPTNAQAHWVAIQRPLTFLASFVYAALALATSAVFSLLRVEPPSCQCPNSSPRTRPRPGGRPLAGLTTPSLVQEPREYASAPSQVVAPSSSVRPPTARRRSIRRLGEFPFHSLDGVQEAEEEDERSDEAERRSPSRSSSDLVPALTPGASETDTDGASEVESIEEDHKHAHGHGTSVVKGLAVLTRGLLPKRSPSHSKKGLPATASPTDESHSTLSTSTASTAARSATRTHPCLSALRSRSATIAHSARPALPSTLAPIEPRRHASDPKDHAAFATLAPGSPTDSASSSSSSPRSSVELDSSAPTKTRKRAATSLFLRSLSPLSRSPGTSPEPSSPTSPRLSTPSSFASKPYALQRPTHLLRTSSASSTSSTDSSSDARRRRGRSPDPVRIKALVASGPMSRAVVDLEGGSGLSLSDLLR
ncbi:hypothetical protein NBRC10513v2_002471 [Rhodotorula toruloides]